MGLKGIRKLLFNYLQDSEFGERVLEILLAKHLKCRFLFSHWIVVGSFEGIFV